MVKYDSCGEYSFGNARFMAFADAVAATGRPMVISTEPYVCNRSPVSTLMLILSCVAAVAMMIASVCGSDVAL